MNEHKIILARKLFLTICLCLIVVPVVACRRLMHKSININQLKNEADVILTGTLIVEALPYEKMSRKLALMYTKIQNTEVYRIKQKTLISGDFDKRRLLIVRTNVRSSYGKHAEIEPDIPYMLFLKKFDYTFGGKAKKIIAYRLVGYWKGIVPLKKTAKERRALKLIKRQYNINIDDMPEVFIEEVKKLESKPE